MIFNPISSQTLQSAQHNQRIDTRLDVHGAGGDYGTSTLLKVSAVAITAFLALIAFTLAGPLVGVVVGLVIGVPLLCWFNGLSRDPSLNNAEATVPWHRRIFTWLPGPSPHVPVGRGHMNGPRPNNGRGGPHVGVGNGHQGGPGRGGPHVGVGDGHLRGRGRGGRGD